MREIFHAKTCDIYPLFKTFYDKISKLQFFMTLCDFMTEWEAYYNTVFGSPFYLQLFGRQGGKILSRCH